MTWVSFSWSSIFRRVILRWPPPCFSIQFLRSTCNNFLDVFLPNSWLVFRKKRREIRFAFCSNVKKRTSQLSMSHPSFWLRLLHERRRKLFLSFCYFPRKTRVWRGSWVGIFWPVELFSLMFTSSACVSSEPSPLLSPFSHHKSSSSCCLIENILFLLSLGMYPDQWKHKNSLTWRNRHHNITWTRWPGAVTDLNDGELSGISSH